MDVIFKEGMSINVVRSDGRVHPAFIAKVKDRDSLVQVEWYEEGEIKGKDVEFESAIKWNPELQTKNTARGSEDSATIKRKVIPVGDRRMTVGKKRLPCRSAVSEISNIYGSRLRPKNTNRLTLVNGGAEMSVKPPVKRQKESPPQQQAVNGNTMKRGPYNPQKSQMATMIAECRAKLTFNPLNMHDTVQEHQITVCVRKRPLNRLEINKNEVDILSIPKKNQIVVHEPKTKVDLTKYIDNHKFKLDYAFDEKSDNELVYKFTAQPLVKTIFDGGFATCFAYGQTGSGKTYTMGGDLSSSSEQGIYALAIKDVFNLLDSPKYRHLNLSVSCSFFEIYGVKVLDLLNAKANLKILEDGKQQVQVVGLKEKAVRETNEVLALIEKGNALRTSGQTSANANSSRSHAIFQIYLRKNSRVHGKLSLIDLAGNERGADTFSADRQTRLEGGEINKSLLALKECIRALGRKGAHLPFRASKLTQVLRDSFVGNKSRTCMIAMVSPGVSCSENTLNTLRYADRVKELGTADEEESETVTKCDSVDEHSEENDDSDDCANFQRSERDLIDNHKLTLNKLKDFEKEGQKLLKIWNKDEYDKEAYIDQWENVVDDAISILLNTKEYIDDFKARLARF